jgi:hypothetical protein
MVSCHHGHVFTSMVKSVGEWHENRDLRTGNGGSSPDGDDVLAW